MREIEFIESMLKETAEYARTQYKRRDAIEITSKSDANDLLTEADLAIQEHIVTAIRKSYPHDAIVGEEAGLNHLPSDPGRRCWFIDPIDGTANFVRGIFPAYGISIGHSRDGAAVCGGVALPDRYTIFLAERGAGATRDGARIQVSAVSELASARAEIDFAHPTRREALMAHCTELIKRVGQVRCHCAAVVGMCSVATGDCDVYVHAGLTPWDFAAALLIAEEAGATATQFDGSPVNLFDRSPSLAVTNGKLHAELLGMLQQK